MVVWFLVVGKEMILQWCTMILSLYNIILGLYVVMTADMQYRTSKPSPSSPISASPPLSASWSPAASVSLEL